MFNKLNPVADTYATRLAEERQALVEKQKLEEAANQFESTHNKILSKLHKEMPHLGLDTASHTTKETYKEVGGVGEHHTYSVNHEPSINPIHNTLLPNLKTNVIFHHHSGSPEIHGEVFHSHGDEHGHSNHVHGIGEFHNHGGKLQYRNRQTGITKEL